MDALRQISLEWYVLLSQAGTKISVPLNMAMSEWNIPALSALLFGFLGSLAPCQMSANVGAIAYLSERLGRETRVWRDTFAFVWGKIMVYTVLGALAILLGLQLPTWAMAFLRKAFGPSMILFAVYMFGLFRFQFSLGDRLSAWLQRRLPGRGDAGAFFLGAACSLSFCPTMALLFFGLLVPLGIRAPGPAGLAFPALFAVGTAVPLLLFAAFLGLGLGLRRDWGRRMRHWHRYIRVTAGVLFLLAGLNDTILYTLA